MRGLSVIMLCVAVLTALCVGSASAQYYQPYSQPQAYLQPVVQPAPVVPPVYAPYHQPCTTVGPSLPSTEAMVQGRQPDVFHYHLHETVQQPHRVYSPACNTPCNPVNTCNYPMYQTYPTCPTQPVYQSQPVYVQQQPQQYYYYPTQSYGSAGCFGGLRFTW